MDRRAASRSSTLEERPIQIIGEHPLAADSQGRLQARIATVFPAARAIVTLPGIHATQRTAFVDQLNRERQARGQPGLTPQAEAAVWQDAVDLILEDHTILIRPDPQEMDLAFRADDFLQEFVSKCRIKFLYTTDQQVRQGVKQRGECWRIVPLPTSAAEMGQMIARSRIGIGGQRVYYYSAGTGTHLLTCQDFSRLADLSDEDLRGQLVEIKDLASRCNRLGYPEVSFFLGDKAFSAEPWAGLDFAAMDAVTLRRTHASLRERFEQSVPPDLRRDDPANLEWRNRMFAALTSQWQGVVPEESLLGLSPEFFMQIEWLPGARIEEGELLFDPVYSEPAQAVGAPRELLAEEEQVRGLIFNFVREYGDLEYINIGRVVHSLGDRPDAGGRRGVFLAEIKRRGPGPELVRVIRMQKWGVIEHLDEGADLLPTLLRADEYIEYVVDRRLGCRQLGMNLPPHLTAHRIAETYNGKQERYRGTRVWTNYFERDYIRGIASTKLPASLLKNPAYALRLARLLGQAAAPNLIVGRGDLQGRVLFDDGDEIVVEDQQHLPSEIVIGDPTGAFAQYKDALEKMIRSYAAPVERRADAVPDPRAFAEAYTAGFIERFAAIQQEYRRRRRAFETLFRDRPQDPAGSYGYRWMQVLKRLDVTEASALGQALRAALKL